MLIPLVLLFVFVIGLYVADLFSGDVSCEYIIPAPHDDWTPE